MCTEALHLFEGLGNPTGQLDALWILSAAKMYLARLYEAEGHIKHALRLYHAAHLSNEELYLFLMNLQAHHAYYSGNSEEGLAVIQEVAPIRQRHLYSKPSLYLTMAEATLQRQRSHYDEALHALDKAEQIAQKTGDEGFLPWIQMERGWTMVRKGDDLATVRHLLLTAPTLQDPATQRFYLFYLAALDALERKWVEAQGRLEAILPQFEQCGELLNAFDCRTYLAYVHIGNDNFEAARQAIEEGMGWAETAACDYFPHVWHPRVVTVVCIEALRCGVRSRQAEMMIIRRLGDSAVPHLLTLLDEAKPDVQQRIRSVLAAMSGRNILQQIEETTQDMVIRSVIIEHLKMGRLAFTKLPVLPERLRIASEADPWSCVAVYGYYAATNLPREQIARRLHLSDSAVKRHIKEIRTAFGVTSSGGRDAGRSLITHKSQQEQLIVCTSNFSADHIGTPPFSADN